MPNDSSRGPTEQPAPNISADFLTGSTEIGLDRIRTRLLDLTNRNKLLNYRYPTASSLRVVGASIDEVYLRLRDNERVAFVPVPEPDLDTDDLPNEKDYADELGWSTSFDLDPSSAKADSGRVLPVLHYPERLDTLSRKIGSAAKTAIEESGTNMLHLVFGFLEWYESDDSKQAHFAPLVTLPVTLERTSGRGKAMESVLEYSGEDVESNLSLAEKMRRDFGLFPLNSSIFVSRRSKVRRLSQHWKPHTLRPTFSGMRRRHSAASLICPDVKATSPLRNCLVMRSRLSKPLYGSVGFHAVTPEQ
jgi:hypothetical protein